MVNIKTIGSFHRKHDGSNLLSAAKFSIIYAILRKLNVILE